MGARIRLEVPRMTIEMVRCTPHLWRKFRDHHYKSHWLNGLASKNCFVGLYEGKPIVMTAAIFNYGALSSAMTDECHFQIHRPDMSEKFKSMREHRTVVLPAYQGIGIGSRF